MSEYESIQRGTGDAMASQSAGNPRSNDALSEASGPHFETDPQVLARMPDLNASEPEVTNTPSRQRRRSPGGVRPGSAASPKVIMFATAAVVVVVAAVYVLNRSDDSDAEQASEQETWDFDSPDVTAPDAPPWSETAETESPYSSTDDPTASPYSAADPSRNAAWDQRNPRNWGQAYDQTPPAPWPNQPGIVADQTPPPTQYHGPQVGDYGVPGAATSDWSNQAAGTAIQAPSAAHAVPESYYGTQSATDQIPYQGQYQTARPPASYRDSTRYGDPNQRMQANPYGADPAPQSVPYYPHSRAPSAAVTIAPPAPSLGGRQPYAPAQTDSGVYGGVDVPAVAQRPIYRSDVRPPSATPYRADTSRPPTYRTPTTQPPGYSPSYGQGTPQTSYPGTNSASVAGSLAPRYGDTATYPYSQPGQPGLATLNGVIERQPPARASYDSTRPSLY